MCYIFQLINRLKFVKHTISSKVDQSFPSRSENEIKKYISKGAQVQMSHPKSQQYLISFKTKHQRLETHNASARIKTQFQISIIKKTWTIMSVIVRLCYRSNKQSI